MAQNMDDPVVLVALVNPKSGGNIGNQLLEQFKEILPPSQVYNLVDECHPGPAKALNDHKNVNNLRLIGKKVSEMLLKKLIIFKFSMWR